jgi:quercetin dioxygenase-like cupin family protein
MAQMHPKPADVIDLNTFGNTTSTALVKEEKFEVIRVVVTPDKPIPQHQVAGPITVQCLRGKCTFYVDQQPQKLEPGSWLYLNGGTPHALQSDETAIVLVTILLENV